MYLSINCTGMIQSLAVKMQANTPLAIKYKSILFLFFFLETRFSLIEIFTFWATNSVNA